jgi:hypothetical protein
MKVYFKRKYISLSRPTVTLLENPSHLVFMFDEPNERLIVLPSFEETFNTYEIPKYFWDDKDQTCQIYRLPFFLTLQRKFNWKSNRVYTIDGIFQYLEEKQKLVVFNFSDAVETLYV